MKRKFTVKPITASTILGQDAGMILETFQDIVDEVEIPEGYTWDYKIDQLENGDPAGQFFIMTDDNQPVYFVTFSLVKDGQPLAILNDASLFDKIVRKLKDGVDRLGNLEDFVGEPKQETIELTTNLRRRHMKRIIKASTSDAYRLMLAYISREFKVNGPKYRGAPMPRYNLYAVNESEFGDNLRYKDYDCSINGDELDIDWLTQEPFLDSEVQALIREIERCVDELYDYFCENIAEEWLTYPKVNVEVESRDGRDYGYYTTSFGG